MTNCIRTLRSPAKMTLTVCGFRKLYKYRIPRDSLCVAICRFDSQLVRIVTAMLTTLSLGQDVSHDGNCWYGHDYSHKTWTNLIYYKCPWESHVEVHVARLMVHESSA